MQMPRKKRQKIGKGSLKERLEAAARAQAPSFYSGRDRAAGAEVEDRRDALEALKLELESRPLLRLMD